MTNKNYYECDVPEDRPWFKYWPPGVPRKLDYPRVPLFNIVEVSATRYPDKDSIIYYGRKISYKELWESINKFATFVNEIGVKKGDRVALFMPNTPQWIIAYFGTLRANGIVVPINPLLAEDELEYILKDSGSKVLVTTTNLLGKVNKIKDKTDVKNIIACRFRDYLPEKPELRPHPIMQNDPEVPSWVIAWNEVMSARVSPPPIEVTVNDIAMIPYTSGSTGLPKGCIHSHFTIWATTLGSAYWFTAVPSAVYLAALPIFHVTGLIHTINVPLYVGAKIVLMTAWDRDTAIDAIERYEVTHWVNISTMVVDLLATPGIEKRNLKSLVVVGGGGAPMPEAVAKRLKDLLGLTYVEGYGLTETISQTHVNPPHRPKLQCLGIPHFCVDALVIDPNTGEVLPPRKEGEIVVRGPNIFLGYWNNEEETKKAFIEINGKKYFRTGDIGYMDEEGYFFFVDRLKRMINRAGFKVWPTRIENIMYQHPAILEVAVVATPDSRVGEEVKAYVVLKPEYKGKITENDIINWAKERMSAYEYPRVIEFVESLPKSGSGKILWRVLQDKEKKGKK
ncbi:MAG: long-chain fatty acid--CoA ligase [Sulfolobaceae archaeon]